MLSEDTVRDLFARASTGADLSIIEGVMGLFDGRSAEDPRGSTAHLAKLLDVPVLLVVDAEATAASIAAVVKGFAEFDPQVRVAAVLCNRVAGPRHYAYLEPAIRKHTRVVPVGWLPRQPEWQIPERHLGLVTQEDLNAGGGLDIEKLAAAFEATVDVDQLVELANNEGSRWRRSAASATPPAAKRRCRVAVARDAAFCFYYQDNLDRLEAAGATITSFSPLRDAALSDEVHLVYLGGGYPELHARQLASNQAMIAALCRHHHQGGAIYAECGGLMYCCRELVNAEGQVFPMLDLLPARTVMQQRFAALGYITWQAQGDTLLGPRGTEVRGHVFHYSRLEPLAALQSSAVLQREGEEARPDGFVNGRLLAGYAHLHFASNPGVVAALLTPPG
jgi:cobyrinic acid a,c-diamide synthase